MKNPKIKLGIILGTGAALSIAAITSVALVSCNQVATTPETLKKYNLDLKSTYSIPEHNVLAASWLPNRNLKKWVKENLFVDINALPDGMDWFETTLQEFPTINNKNLTTRHIDVKVLKKFDESTNKLIDVVNPKTTTIEITDFVPLSLNKIYDIEVVRNDSGINEYIISKANEVLNFPINFAIPKGVTEIKNGAFNNLSELEIITIPSSVNKIGELIFKNSGKLNTINFDGNYLIEEPFVNYHDKAFSESNKDIKIYFWNNREKLNSKFIEKYSNNFHLVDNHIEKKSYDLNIKNNVTIDKANILVAYWNPTKDELYQWVINNVFNDKDKLPTEKFFEAKLLDFAHPLSEKTSTHRVISINLTKSIDTNTNELVSNKTPLETIYVTVEGFAPLSILNNYDVISEFNGDKNTFKIQRNGFGSTTPGSFIIPYGVNYFDKVLNFSGNKNINTLVLPETLMEEFDISLFKDCYELKEIQFQNRAMLDKFIEKNPNWKLTSEEANEDGYYVTVIKNKVNK